MAASGCATRRIAVFRSAQTSIRHGASKLDTRADAFTQSPRSPLCSCATTSNEPKIVVLFLHEKDDDEHDAAILEIQERLLPPSQPCELNAIAVEIFWIGVCQHISDGIDARPLPRLPAVPA
jgi:hypothetical protein